MKKYRVIIAGSRSLPENTDQIEQKVIKIISRIPLGHLEIVSGGAKGADRLGEGIAKLIKVPVKQFLPDYEKYAKYAPLERNRRMSEYGTHLIAIWDQKSRGTVDMIDWAKKNKLQIRIIKF